jgi:hypothetical protein
MLGETHVYGSDPDVLYRSLYSTGLNTQTTVSSIIDQWDGGGDAVIVGPQTVDTPAEGPTIEPAAGQSDDS